MKHPRMQIGVDALPRECYHRSMPCRCGPDDSGILGQRGNRAVFSRPDPIGGDGIGAGRFERLRLGGGGGGQMRRTSERRPRHGERRSSLVVENPSPPALRTTRGLLSERSSLPFTSRRRSPPSPFLLSPGPGPGGALSWRRRHGRPKQDKRAAHPGTGGIT